MGMSEIETPMLQDEEHLATDPRVSEEGGMWRKSSRGSQWRLWGLARLGMTITCCIGAMIALQSLSIYAPRKLGLWNRGGELTYEGGKEGGPGFDYYAAQRTTFHFQPVDNFMSDPCGERQSLPRSFINTVFLGGI